MYSQNDDLSKYYVHDCLFCVSVCGAVLAGTEFLHENPPGRRQQTCTSCLRLAELGSH